MAKYTYPFFMCVNVDNIYIYIYICYALSLLHAAVIQVHVHRDCEKSGVSTIYAHSVNIHVTNPSGRGPCLKLVKSC